MFDHRIYFVELYVQSVVIIHKICLEEDELDPPIAFAALCHQGLRHMCDILRFHKDNHQQVRSLLICGKQLFLGAEVNIPIVIDMGLIAEIVILHIVELIKDAIVEHIGEHILLPD